MTAELTAQEIFDTVLAHLRAQGFAAVDAGGSCAYRGENGRKCAVGCMISDDEYDVSMEGECSSNITLPARLRDHRPMLAQLQEAHDETLLDAGLAAWEKHMSKIAADFGLSYEVAQ